MREGKYPVKLYAPGTGLGFKLKNRLASLKKPWLWLLLPMVGLLTGFFLIPLLWLIRMSLYDRPASNSSGGSRFYDPNSFTFKQYGDILTDSYYFTIISTTFLQAALITFVVMLLAYPCAIMIHRFSARLKTTALLVVILTKLTNLLVLTYGLLVLLSNSGIINSSLQKLGLIKEPISMFSNLFAVVVAETVIIAPYPVLIIVSALEGQDPTLEQAARGLGAWPLRAFYETSFKLTWSATLGASFIVFNWALGAYIGPLVMGNPDTYTVAVEVYNATFSQNNWPLGAALAVSNILLLVGLLITINLMPRLLKRAVQIGRTGA